MSKTALIIVDCQYDFLPGGSLAVEKGNEILEPIQQLLSESDWNWGVVVASEDYHPKGHISFASRHGKEPFDALELERPNGEKYTQVLWPDHCVQGTRGAKIEEGLQASLDSYKGEKLLARKGYDIEVEAYSAFTGYLSDPSGPSSPPPPTRPYDDSTSSISHGELAEALRKRGITKVVVAGLALDVWCVSPPAYSDNSVAATAMDSVRSEFQSAILRPLTRGVKREKCEDVRSEFMKAGGVMIGSSDDVSNDDWRRELRSWIA